MQSAKYEGARYDAREVTDGWARPRSRAHAFSCPGCEETVWFAKGPKRAAHFKHKRRLPFCPFEKDDDYKPERDLHVRLKYALRDWAVRALATQHPGVRAEVEVRIPETGRVADALAELPDGRRLAFEVQCSALSLDDWAARAADYARAGVLDFWFFAGDRYPQDAFDELRRLIIRTRGWVL